jgi:hypothetical protein
METRKITINRAEGGLTTLLGNGDGPQNREVRLTATALEGYRFVQWQVTKVPRPTTQGCCAEEPGVYPIRDTRLIRGPATLRDDFGPVREVPDGVILRYETTTTCDQDCQARTQVLPQSIMIVDDDTETPIG